MSKAEASLRKAKESLLEFSKLMEGGSVSKSDRESFKSILDSFDKFEKTMTEEVDHIKSDPQSKEIMPLDANSDSERLMI